jgi:hypothetical protein
MQCVVVNGSQTKKLQSKEAILLLARQKNILTPASSLVKDIFPLPFEFKSSESVNPTCALPFANNNC